MTKSTQWIYRLWTMVMAVIFSVGITTGVAVTAEEVHPVEYYQEYLMDEVCNHFFQETKPIAVWSETDEWAGTYVDGQWSLHICMTDGVDLTPYKEMLDDEALARLATNLTKNMNCPYTVEQLLQGFSVTFEHKPHSVAYLEHMRTALREPFEKLKIWETSVSYADNQVEIRVENEADRAGVIAWLSQNVENFDENAVNVMAEKNTAQLDKNATMDTYNEDIAEKSMEMRIGNHLISVERFWEIVAVTVIGMALITTVIILLCRHFKKKNTP